MSSYTRGIWSSLGCQCGAVIERCIQSLVHLPTSWRGAAVMLTETLGGVFIVHTKTTSKQASKQSHGDTLYLYRVRCGKEVSHTQAGPWCSPAHH